VPRKSDHLTYAINFARYQSKRAKTDAEKRRMFDRFLFLSGLLPKEMFHPIDDNPNGKPTDNLVVKEPSLDEKAQAMLRQLQGGDDGNDTCSTADSVSTNRR
jgi:hypothetical protein